MNIEELEKITGKTLLDWQRKFVEDEGQLIVMKMGRKCGKTWAIAFRIALDSLNRDFSNTDGILILSKGQRQSSEIFMTVKGILQKCGINMAPYEKKSKDGTKEGGWAYATRTRIILPGGNRIFSLPAGYTGDTLRTYSFWKIYFDEAAYIPEDVFVSTDACLAVYGVQEVYASTPDLSSGKFYNVWHSEFARRYERMTKQCGLVKAEFLYRKKREMTKLDYQREYEGKFVEAAEGLFLRELIAACMSKEKLDKQKLFGKGVVFLGVDFARFGKDDNVIAACHWIEGKAYIHVEIIHGRFRTTKITGRILHLVRLHSNIKKVVTDEGGVGGGATDALVAAIGARRVIGVANQKRVDAGEGRRSRYLKVDLYTNLIRLMENGFVVLDNEIRIVRSLRSMRYSYTSKGDLTIYGHDSHVAEAVVRAVFPLVSRAGRLSLSHEQTFFFAVPHNEAETLSDLRENIKA